MTVPTGWLVVPTNPGVKALVTNRHHPKGQSLGAMASFNLGDHVGDSGAVVASHRELLTTLVGDLPVQWLRQVHGTECFDVLEHSEQPPQADAACTQNADVALAVMTADCLPILFWNRQGSEIGVCHAGWRGLLEGVIESTIAGMQSRAEDLAAWIGPCISADNYEVGADVWQNFSNTSEQAYMRAHEDASKRWLDLDGLAKQRLIAAGVRELRSAGVCTYQNKDFFSHRRHQHSGVGGECGRFASLIWLDRTSS